LSCAVRQVGRELVLVRIWRIVDPTITRSLVLATTTQRPSPKPARTLTRIFKELIASHVQGGRCSPP
jgi:LysR family nitrogen assimilation transcriptional regulator